MLQKVKGNWARKKPEPLLKEIINNLRRLLLKKTMAMYPMELHLPIKGEWFFYLACELKFQLNSIADDDETMRLPLFNSMICGPRLIVWMMILGHWKDHNRIMPTESHEDSGFW
jgi:hypothetical protein